jgi:hypothetical protein
MPYNYTDQECLAALRRAAARYGQDIIVEEYRESGESPSAKTLENRFGSWNEAKRAAGLDVYEHGENRTVRPPRYEVTDEGYTYISTQFGDERWYVPIHRLVAVAEFGIEAVQESTDVHHRNGVPWDNRPENLGLMDHAEHARMHRLEAVSADHA